MKRVPLEDGVIVHVSTDEWLAAHIEIADEDSVEIGRTLQDELRSQYERMFLARVDQKFLDLVEKYAALKDKPNIGVLNAHGTSRDGLWVYQDGIRFRTVSSWIKAHEHEYAAVVLMVCNGNQCNIPPAETLIFMPDNLVGSGILFDAEHDIHFTLMTPSGEEIDSYTIDYYLDHVEELLQNTKPELL